MSDYDDIRKALSYIDPHDREVWVNTGYSLKNELGENGFDVWDAWSRQSDNYNARAARSVWKSMKNPTRTIASLFHDARANGYRPDKPYTPPPPEEQARIRAEREAGRIAAEAAQAAAHERVKHTAQRIWAQAAPADASHPYLAAKGITDVAAIAGLRQNHYRGGNNLLVPVVFNREIVNLQSINQDGGKRFLADGQVQSDFSVVGDANQTDNGIVIAEGFATAASIHQATGKPVIVAFNAGNMVAVSERLAQNLPADVPVVIAVDNDASQTGMKMALKAAARFGGRAQVVEPEFTMTQIRQYQLENGADSQGRPKLPSDFNDLHRLAGIGAVREKIEAAFRQQEPAQTAEPAPEATSEAEPAPREAAALFTDEEWAAVAAEEARISGMKIPAQPEPAAQAAAGAADTTQEQQMGNEANTNTGQTVTSEKPSEHEAVSENGIEYAALRPERKHEAYQSADPGHVYGSGRAPADGVQGGAAAGDTAVPETSAAEPESAPEAEPAQNEPQAIPADAAVSVKKPVIDLHYRIPPESIKGRYVVADGKYLSAANHTTVVFTDKGKKISTAKTDAQTINDMLEVAKEKGWDSIKLSGNKEFKAMMYVAAESQGIRTSGYRPTPEDLALLEKLRQERSLNSIEAQASPAPEKVAPAPYPGDKRQRPSESQAEAAAPTVAAEKAGERIVSVGSAPYRHNPNNRPSPYIVLERGGKERTVWGVDIPDAVERSGAEVGDRIRLHELGKQPVVIDVPDYDNEGKVTGYSKKEVHRNLFKMDVVGEKPDQVQEKVRTKPDVVALSKAEKMLVQNSMPSDAAINVSPKADTQAGVPLQSIGQNEIPGGAANRAAQMKAAALETGFVSAKSVYAEKAAKLSKPNQARLQWHERNVLDTIRGLKGEARTLALKNYYEHTSKHMSGSKLKLPRPMQVPKPAQGNDPNLQQERFQQQSRSQQQGHNRGQAPEMER